MSNFSTGDCLGSRFLKSCMCPTPPAPHPMGLRSRADLSDVTHPVGLTCATKADQTDSSSERLHKKRPLKPIQIIPIVSF